MQSLISIRDKEYVQSGLYPSLAANQLALWRDGSNVDFVEGGAEKTKGWNVQPNTSVAGQTYKIVALTQAAVEAERRVYAGLSGATYSALRLWADGAGRDLGHTYSQGWWSLETWGTWLIATNDVNVVQVWKGGVSDAEALANVPVSRAKIVRKLANHVLLFNTNRSGQEVVWCSRSNPEEWEVTTETTAGAFTVRDMDGDFTAVEPLGQGLAFYTNDSMGLCTYIGAPFYFSLLVKINGIGAVGGRVVVPVGQQHFGLSRKGFWRSDGYALAYIDSPQFKKWFQANVDWTKAEEICGFHNEMLERVEWYFTDKLGARIGMAFNYNLGTWAKLDKPVTAVIEQQVYDTPIAATGTGFGYFGLGNNANGAEMLSNLKTAAFDGGQKERFKRWDMVRVEYEEGQGTLEIRFGFSDTSPKDEDLSWTDWQELARENWIGSGGRDSVYMAFEIRSTGTDTSWRIGGVDVLGEMGSYL